MCCCCFSSSTSKCTHLTLRWKRLSSPWSLCGQWPFTLLQCCWHSFYGPWWVERLSGPRLASTIAAPPCYRQGSLHHRSPTAYRHACHHNDSIGLGWLRPDPDQDWNWSLAHLPSALPTELSHPVKGNISDERWTLSIVDITFMVSVWQA